MCVRDSKSAAKIKDKGAYGRMRKDETTRKYARCGRMIQHGNTHATDWVVEGR